VRFQCCHHFCRYELCSSGTLERPATVFADPDALDGP
jgi:hypothetical protein